jgi:hypothetical protein
MFFPFCKYDLLFVLSVFRFSYYRNRVLIKNPSSGFQRRVFFITFIFDNYGLIPSKKQQYVRGQAHCVLSVFFAVVFISVHSSFLYQTRELPRSSPKLKYFSGMYYHFDVLMIFNEIHFNRHFMLSPILFPQRSNIHCCAIVYVSVRNFMRQKMIFFMNARSDFMFFNKFKRFFKLFLILRSKEIITHRKKNCIFLCNMCSQQFDILY